MIFLRVNEIFYSIQGEGHRVGTANLFIRLSGCSAQVSCRKMGVICDTEFETGIDYSVEQILAIIRSMAPLCKSIIWAGGEPTDQLKDDHVAYFSNAGYYQAMETSGIRPPSYLLDWVTLSPKVPDHIIAKNFVLGVNEVKYVVDKDSPLPACPVPCSHKFLSPMFDFALPDFGNIAHAIMLVCENPEWRLTVQLHKFIGVK